VYFVRETGEFTCPGKFGSEFWLIIIGLTFQALNDRNPCISFLFLNLVTVFFWYVSLARLYHDFIRLWHMYPLLGNHHRINEYKIAITTQRLWKQMCLYNKRIPRCGAVSYEWPILGQVESWRDCSSVEQWYRLSYCSYNLWVFNKFDYQSESHQNNHTPYTWRCIFVSIIHVGMSLENLNRTHLLFVCTYC
jgi:hypothetical protein